MKIWTARLSRKRAAAAVIALGVVIAALILLLGRGSGEAPAAPLLTNNEERVAYLQSLGWEVTPEPVETLQFLLPSQLKEPYLSYNTIQAEQGFDLSLGCGKQVARYTYAVTNYPGRPEGIQANLYICEDAVIAGDICCPGADGFQAALAFPAEDGAE